MKVNKDERDALVSYRLEKAIATLIEAEGNIEMKYWHTAANRLYYACYYAVSALLIDNGFTAQTHSGVIHLFGLHFIKTGKISKELGKFYSDIFELRQTGDYSDIIPIEENEIKPMLEPVKLFVQTIKKLINNNDLL